MRSRSLMIRDWSGAPVLALQQTVPRLTSPCIKSRESTRATTAVFRRWTASHLCRDDTGASDAIHRRDVGTRFS